MRAPLQWIVPSGPPPMRENFLRFTAVNPMFARDACLPLLTPRWRCAILVADRMREGHMSAPFHFHIQEEFPPTIDGDPGCWVVDGCCPADDIASFEKSRTAFLCTSNIWEVPVSFEQCVFQTHKDCHEGGWTCRHQRDYKPVRGSKIYSPGMPKAEWEALEHERWLKCRVCQSKTDSMYGTYCPGH